MSRRPDSPLPDAASLHQAALSYLARYAATEAGLRRILTRRIDQWAQVQADRDAAAPTITAALKAIDGVVQALVRAGAVNDTGFAEVRARSLLHTGRSRRAIQARLVAKGIAPDLARDAMGDDAASELAAALILTRRRRIGPFRQVDFRHPGPGDLQAVQRKELGMLARAGFTRETAQRALAMDAAEAERRIHALRSDQPITD